MRVDAQVVVLGGVQALAEVAGEHWSGGEGGVQSDYLDAVGEVGGDGGRRGGGRGLRKRRAKEAAALSAEATNLIASLRSSPLVVKEGVSMASLDVIVSSRSSLNPFSSSPADRGRPLWRREKTLAGRGRLWCGAPRGR